MSLKGSIYLISKGDWNLKLLMYRMNGKLIIKVFVIIKSDVFVKM